VTESAPPLAVTVFPLLSKIETPGIGISAYFTSV
jgi:hypothetical protein